MSQARCGAIRTRPTTSQITAGVEETVPEAAYDVEALGLLRIEKGFLTGADMPETFGILPVS